MITLQELTTTGIPCTDNCLYRVEESGHRVELTRFSRLSYDWEVAYIGEIDLPVILELIGKLREFVRPYEEALKEEKKVVSRLYSGESEFRIVANSFDKDSCWLEKKEGEEFVPIQLADAPESSYYGILHALAMGTLGLVKKEDLHWSERH